MLHVARVTIASLVVNPTLAVETSISGSYSVRSCEKDPVVPPVDIPTWTTCLATLQAVRLLATTQFSKVFQSPLELKSSKSNVLF